MVISILVFRLLQSSEFFNKSINLPASSGLMKSGSRFPIFGDITLVIGVSSNRPFFTRCLKNDFKDDIFLFIVLELILFSFILASQLRMWLWVISDTRILPNSSSR